MNRVTLAHAVAIFVVTGEALQFVVTPLSFAALFPWGLTTLAFVATTLVAGWLLARKRPQVALGWILLAIAFLFALQGPTLALGLALERSAPVPASWLVSYGSGNSQWSWLPPVGLLFTQIPLRFPTGALPSARWTWFSRYSICALAVATVVTATSGRTVTNQVANPFYVDWGSATDVVTALPIVICAPAFVGGIASLFVRYRHVDALQRTQLRWVFWAVTVTGGLLLIGPWAEGWASAITSPRGVGADVAAGMEFVVSLGYSLIPVAILFAVLRYGLYSIDRIISRTASYAIVTLSVVVVYGAIVVLASLLPGLQSFGVALATLVVAALFLPLLRVVRRIVDRRFNREQYNAQHVVDAFGQRIRNGANPHSAGRDLLGAVTLTLQPTTIGLWTREGSR